MVSPTILGLTNGGIETGLFYENVSLQPADAEGFYSKIFACSGGAATRFDGTVDRGMARVKDLQRDAIESRRLRDKAEARLRQEQALGSRGFGHRPDLARLLLEKGRSQDVAQALTLMQEEVKIRRDAFTLDTLGWALSACGEWQKVDRVMTEIRRSGIRDAGMFYRAGAIARTLGKDTESRAYCQKSKEIDPSFDNRSRQALGLGSYEFSAVGAGSPINLWDIDNLDKPAPTRRENS